MSKVGPGGGNIRAPQDEPKTNTEQQGVSGSESGGGGEAAAAALHAGGNKRVMSAADVERLASQAGFARTGGRKKNKNIDVGDSSQAPIPLPEDDLEGNDYSNGMSYEGLDQAQAQLLHHKAALTRTRGKGIKNLLGMWESLIAGDGTSDEDDDVDDARQARSRHLQQMQAEIPPDAEALAGLTASIREQFGIDLAGSPVGPQMMAASLLVAGQREDVAVTTSPAGASTAAPTLDAERLFAGAGRVIDAGRQAADDARKRADGMQRNLSFHRTFVPKR